MFRRLQFTFPDGAILISCANQKLSTLQAIHLYSKLCVISFFAKKVHYLPPKHVSRCFSNEFSQQYWLESFDGDSSVSQSSFDANAQPTSATPLVSKHDAAENTKT